MCIYVWDKTKNISFQRSSFGAPPGIMLSGGQKQRLAVARCFLRKPTNLGQQTFFLCSFTVKGKPKKSVPESLQNKVQFFLAFLKLPNDMFFVWAKGYTLVSEVLGSFLAFTRLSLGDGKDILGTLQLRCQIAKVCFEEQKAGFQNAPVPKKEKVGYKWPFLFQEFLPTSARREWPGVGPVFFLVYFDYYQNQQRLNL